MIEKLLKIATIENPVVAQELLNTAIELKDSPFVNDFKSNQRTILENAENQMPKLAMKLGMSISELDGCLSLELEKKAANMGVGGHLGRAAGEIGLSAIGSVARLALNDLYHSGKGALTEKRYYEKMMKENPDLHEFEPGRVKSLFKTLHSLGGTELSSDPNVAGTFIRGNMMYDKGVDMEPLHKMIGSRQNLQRSRDVIEGPQGVPGMNLLQRQQEHEKNQEMGSNNQKNYQLNKSQHEYRQSRDVLEDMRFDNEDSRNQERHEWDRHKDEHATSDDQRRREMHAHQLATDLRREGRDIMKLRDDMKHHRFQRMGHR